MVTVVSRQKKDHVTGTRRGQKKCFIGPTSQLAVSAETAHQRNNYTDQLL